MGSDVDSTRGHRYNCNCGSNLRDMIDFQCGSLSYGVAPAEYADDPEILTDAQKWANVQGKEVHFIQWDGFVVNIVEPENAPGTDNRASR